MHKLPSTLPAFFWHFLKTRKAYPICLLCTGTIYAILTSLIPLSLKAIIDTLTSSSPPFSSIQIPALAYFILGTAQAINWRAAEFIHLKFLPQLTTDIKSSMFQYLNLHSYSYFQNNFAGALANKISDMAKATRAIANQFDELSAVGIAVLIAITTMAFVHPIFAAIISLWVISLIVITIFFNKKTVHLAKDFSEARSSSIGKIVDSTTNFINLISFARHSYENQQIQDALDDTKDKDTSLHKQVLWMRIIQDFSFETLIGAMLISLIVLYQKALITPGDFVLILTLTSAITQPVWWVINRFAELAEEIGRANQALSIIAQPHQISDAPNASPISISQGKIRFHNVTHSYENSPAIFNNKSTTILPRQKVGLVGYSGAGKSSFVNLILRFFEPSSGHISIDDQDISQVTLSSLRESISYIPQDTSLFHRSLHENILYGNPSASKEQIIQAAKNAHAHEFIMDLPKQYDTLVGERGIKLSGGQRQRIAIARAFLKDAPILILDEATSALDSQTEALIQESLQSLIKNRTTIIIAHRLSTLSHMDRILVFDKGKIIQDGPHSQLINQPGHYQDLHKMQSQGFLPE